MSVREEAALGPPGGRLSALFTLGTVGFVSLATLVALAADLPLVAIAVPFLAGAVYGIYKLPLRAAVLGTLFAVLALEGLQYALGTKDEWPVPVLHPIAKALFLNLSTQMGGGPLRAPVIDIVTLALFFVSMGRHPREGWAAKQPTVRAMHMVMWTAAITAVGLVLLGMVQGDGTFDESLWQVRHTVMFPVRAVVLMRALDCRPDELRLVGRLLVAAAVLKALVGLWFLYVVAAGLGIEVPFTTSHTDTLLFVPVLAMYVARALEARSKPQLWAGLIWAPIVFWGLVANDRRISYVSLCIGVVVMMVLAPPRPVKRAFAGALVLLTPLLPWYVIAGWSSDGRGVWFPVGVLKSLVVGDVRYQGEVDYRELENLDVLYTWSQHKLLPLGFGHTFDQLFPLPDITSWFAQWQFHPHNSLLWFFTVGGPFFGTLMLLPHVVTLYLAARAYRASTDFTERVALLTAIATVIAFFNQIWGDMGTLQWTASWMTALAAAVAAKLAMKTGAWPSVLRVRREED